MKASEQYFHVVLFVLDILKTDICDFLYFELYLCTWKPAVRRPSKQWQPQVVVHNALWGVLSKTLRRKKATTKIKNFHLYDTVLKLVSITFYRIQTKAFKQLVRGNKCRFNQIFVEALEEFPTLIIQSKTSASTHEYSENCVDDNFRRQHFALNGYRMVHFEAQVRLS